MIQLHRLGAEVIPNTEAYNIAYNRVIRYVVKR